MKYIILLLFLSNSFFSQPLASDEYSQTHWQSRGLVVSPVKSEAGNVDFAVLGVPVGTDLFLNVNAQKEGNYSIEVYDATGKLLNQVKTRLISNSLSQKFSFADYPGGIYMVKVTNEDAPASKLLRIIK